MMEVGLFSVEKTMSFSRKATLIVLSAAICATVSATALGLPAPARAQDSEPITLTVPEYELVATLDPQKVEDIVSANVVENLFLGLTDVDPQTAQIRAEVATSWERSEDGTVWTFTLRDDVPWVRWDSAAQQAVELRKVTAADFEYGIKRACDPRVAGLYLGVVAAMVEGCQVVATMDPFSIQESDFDAVQVRALSDTQLQITTRGVLGFFLNATSLWMFRAVPREMIAEYGDSWADPTNIVTNGPYVIDQWDDNVARVFLANPLYPNVNERYGGNIERIVQLMMSDAGTAYTLYQNNEIDITLALMSEMNNLRSDPVLSQEIVQRTELATYYFGFMYDKPPFDNVHVRRAFSAIIDRRRFVDEMAGGLGVPIAHFMPPGIRGAVPIDEVGVGDDPANLGYDPEYAREQMELGGYPNCEGFPDVRILTYAGAGFWGEFLAQAAETHLGCDPALFTIEQAGFIDLIEGIKNDVPTSQRPNVYTLGWIADYPDAHNWMHDVLSCNTDNPHMRPCGELDELIDAAGRESDPATRDQMYRELETRMFGEEGEFPIAPLYVNINILLVKPWYKGFFASDGLFGGEHWDSRSIDVEMRNAARGGQ
jgi:oligopeptide transport system substrate-binding protein